MDVGGFDVEEQAMRAAGFHLGGVVDDLDADVTVVRTHLDAVLTGGWTGRSGQSFALGWQEWARGFDECRAALRAMARMLEDTASSYAQAEAGARESATAAGGVLR
jgi:WXG100 family type VII secretion target